MLSRWAVIVVVLSAGIYLSLKANLEYYSSFHGKNSDQIKKEFIETGKYKQFANIPTSDLIYYTDYHNKDSLQIIEQKSYKDIEGVLVLPDSINKFQSIINLSKEEAIDSLYNRFKRDYIDNLRLSSIALGIDLQGGTRLDIELKLINLLMNRYDYIIDKNFSKDFLKNIKGDASAKVFISKLTDELKLSDTDKDNLNTVLNAALHSAKETYRTRLTDLGRSAKIKTSSPNRISVIIPGIVDTDEIKALLGKKGELEFIIVKDKTADWNKIITRINLYNNEFSNLITPYFDSNAIETPYIYIPNFKIEKINKIINDDNVEKQLKLKKSKFLWGKKNQKEGHTALYYLNRDVKLTGADLNKERILAKKGDLSSVDVNKWRIDIEFKDAKKFKKLTERYKDKPLAIILDDVVQISPKLGVVIDNGAAFIDGDFKSKEAKLIASVLKSGELASEVSFKNIKIVSPSMAKEDQYNSLLALGISFALVLVFMIFYYKVFGFIANIAMLLNIPIIIGIISTSAFKDYDVTELSLFGIFGFVLTIGMAIDANVIIFERIKEEFSKNKKAFDAIEIGYKKAFRTILDSNLTTLLAAIALAVFGGELTKNFGYMLILGLGSSMFTSIFITKTIAMTYFKIKPFKRLSI